MTERPGNDPKEFEVRVKDDLNEAEPKPADLIPLEEESDEPGLQGIKSPTLGKISMEEGIRRLIATGKKQGYITYENFNKFFPEECNSPERIDRVFAVLEQYGIELRDDPVQLDELNADGEGLPEKSMTRCACTSPRWERFPF